MPPSEKMDQSSKKWVSCHTTQHWKKRSDQLSHQDFRVGAYHLRAVVLLPRPVLADRVLPWVYRVVAVLFFCCWLPSHFLFQANTGTWQRGHMHLQMISTGVWTGILSIRVSVKESMGGCVSVCLYSTRLYVCPCFDMESMGVYCTCPHLCACLSIHNIYGVYVCRV